MWHCPHCGAPQAETARCWVCRRSSTTCSTCTHFRRALAGDLGYCGLDARRRPLTGLELRGCWEPNPAAVAEAEQARSAMAVEPHRLRAKRPAVHAYRNDPPALLRDFVPVELIAGRGTAPVRPRSKPTAAPASGKPAANTSPEPAAAADAAPAAAADVPPAAAADTAPTTDMPPAFVIEPDPGWAERTSLFGDPEG